MLFFILLFNEHNIAEYEAYWLISVPIINTWGARQPFFFAAKRIKQPKLLCFQKSEQTSSYKEINFTGNRDHINKK